MDPFSEDLHRITLYTEQRKPLLEGDLKALAELGLRNLPVRFPGLRILASLVLPDSVEMTLDFQRLDEDVLRVVQSFKSEVRNLAQKKGLAGGSLWQWNYDDSMGQGASQPLPGDPGGPSPG